MKSRYRLLTMTVLAIALANLAHPVTAQNTPQCDPGMLCLGDGRFEITAEWQSSSGSGTGHPVLLTESTGYFWFFDPANVELLIKVLDACADYGHEWVFAGGLTDVGVTLTVVDRHTGISKTYTNPQGTAFSPIQDTDTFTSDCVPLPPPPSGDLTGQWAGQFDSVDRIGLIDDDFHVHYVDCGSVWVTASANFTQQGSAVDGTLNAVSGGCGPGSLTFSGTLEGDHLEGAIRTVPPYFIYPRAAAAHGTLSGTTLELTLDGELGGQVGIFYLHRWVH